MSRPASPPKAAVSQRRIKLPKMAELVANAIKKQIIQGELPPGSMLPPESVLMEEFGVSRPTLREAFRVLESEALVAIQRGLRGGSKVLQPTPEVAARHAGLLLQYQGTSLSDVYDVRALLEAPCAAALARKGSLADIEELRTRLKEAEGAETDDPDRLVAAHTAFHAALVRLVGNKTLTLLHDLVNHIIDQDYSARAVIEGGNPEWQHFGDVTLKTHRLLIDMIESGDADGAERLWRRHLAEGALYALSHGDPSKNLDLF